MESNVIYTGSNANGDGRIYPDSAEVRRVGDKFEVWDVTGWNGYETCGDQWIATFNYEQDAIRFVRQNFDRLRNSLTR